MFTFSYFDIIFENWKKYKSQFGNRMVCAAGNANHRRKFKEDMERRYAAIHEWQAKKYEKLQKLRAQRDHYWVNRIEFHIIN